MRIEIRPPRGGTVPEAEDIAAIVAVLKTAAAESVAKMPPKNALPRWRLAGREYGGMYEAVHRRHGIAALGIRRR
ncbi:MAG: hypothetical protein M3R44_00770 [Candidatus Eremiobacteraeota bacterium]|nr:hypothetical protein [Candidatus Eremiobacteraeota bacterium]